MEPMENTLPEKTVFEVARFTVKPDQHDLFLQEWPKVEQLLVEQEGFLNLRRFHGESGYTDLVEWQSMQHAHQAAQVIMGHPDTQLWQSTFGQILSFEHGHLVHSR